MKQIIAIVFIIIFLVSLNKLTNYDGRMKQINKYNCAVIGKAEDCKTQLSVDAQLK